LRGTGWTGIPLCTIAYPIDTSAIIETNHFLAGIKDLALHTAIPLGTIAEATFACTAIETNDGLARVVVIVATAKE